MELNRLRRLWILVRQPLTPQAKGTALSMMRRDAGRLSLPELLVASGGIKR